MRRVIRSLYVFLVLMPTLVCWGSVYECSAFVYSDSFSFQNIDIGVDRVVVDGCVLRFEEGSYLKPVRKVRIAVPECSSPVLSVSGTSYIDYPHVKLTPYHGRLEDYPLYRGTSGKSTGFKVAEITGEGRIRYQRYVEVTLFPLQYDEISRTLRFFKNITISVTLEGAEINDKIKSSLHDKHFEENYKHSFVNYEDSKHFRTEIVRDFSQIYPTAPTVQATTSSYKMTVNSDGIYRLTYSYLSAADPLFASSNPANFHIMNQGVEIAINFSGDGDSTFESGEYFEFYGKAYTGENVAGEFQNGDYTDDNIYTIWADDSAGVRCTTYNAQPVNGYSIPLSFYDTLKYEGFSSSSIFMFVDTAGDDCFLWKRPYHFSGQNSSADIANATADHTDILTPSIDSSQPTADIDFCLRGSSKKTENPDHHSIIRVNGYQVSEAFWNDRQTYHHIDSFPSSYLQANNTVTLYVEDPASMGVSSDYIYSNWIQIGYYRLFEAYNDVLEFDYADGLKEFQLSGFSSDSINVWDISNPDSPRIAVNTAISSGTVSFEGDSSGEVTYYVFEDNAYNTPVSITKDNPSTLKSDTTQTDYIIISHKNFISSTSVSDLISLRQSQGMSTRLVDVEDIFDEFNYGIYSVQAIKDFLSYAFYNWDSPAPAYVVLLGDGTFDHKNQLAQPDDGYDFIPAKVVNVPSDLYVGYYSSDLWYTLLAGSDYLPEMHIGRIPGRTLTEIEGAIDKIITNDQGPDLGTWRANSLIMADYDSTCGDTTFTAVSDALISHINSPNSYDKLYYSDAPWSCSTIDGDSDSINDIVEFIDSGTALVSWTGHGAWQFWGNDMLFDDTTVDELAIQAKYPFIVNATCYAAGFHHATVSPVLGEKFLCTPSKAAVAYIGPSTYTYPFLAYQQAESIFKGIFGKDKIRELGSAVYEARKALDEGGDIIGINSYTFLGDPASTLVLPAPAPPSSLVVDSVDDGVVNLSWTASPDSVSGYNLYRSALSDGEYVKINSSLITVLNYQDSGLTNTNTYYYYVVAIDSDNFESAASNIVSATPLNPNPPAIPTGLTVTDSAIGRRLDISWNSNSESDLSGYTLHYGTSSGTYTNQIDNGLSTSVTVGSLTDGTTYYFAVTATNTSSLTSGYSSEQSGIPTHSTAFNPPRLMTDIGISKNGNNLVLNWTAPVETIYGDTVNLDRFSIYRSTDPSWVPDRNTTSSVDRIGEVNYDGNSNYSFTDSSIDLSTDGNNYFYHISSYDSADLESSVARYLPDITYDVNISTGRGGIVDLSWNAVTTDFYNNPIRVDYYNIYRSSVPSFLPDRNNHSNLLDYTSEVQTTECTYSYTSDGSTYYYKVLAVDSKGNEGPE